MLPNAPPPRRPTIRDVARLAGVSLKSVSRVVNHEPSVSAVLTERVERAIAELGYHPDERARNLRRTDARPSSIGFVAVDVANPFFSAILRGLEEVARERDCLVLAGSTDGDPGRQAELINTFVSRRVAGLAVVPSGADLGPLTAESVRGTPVVFVDREPPGDEHAADVVRTDHREGSRLITSHLIARGHRQIAFVGADPMVHSLELRVAGFRDAHDEAGLTVDDQLILEGVRSPAEWRTQLRDWLSAGTPRPTALVTGMNYATMGAVRALRDLGLQHRVALIGFDDFEFSDVVEPGISVTPQDPVLLGRRAAELLFRRLDGETGPPAHVLLASTIVARGSGEIPGPHDRPPIAGAAR